MNKTVQQLIDEYKNRQNPKYSYLGIMDNNGSIERFSDVSNIEETTEWLEFDTVCDITNMYPNSSIITTHIKTKAHIVEYHEVISDVKKHA